MKIKNLLQKMQKGSILAYSLIIMTAMLTIAIGLSIVTVSGKKNATDTQSSVQSFQYASEGSQFVTKKIASSTDENDKIDYIFSGSSCVSDGSEAYIKGSDDRYKVFLYSDESGATKITECSKEIKDIKSIKSVGLYKNTSRAVQVALAASSISTEQLSVTTVGLLAVNCLANVCEKSKTTTEKRDFCALTSTELEILDNKHTDHYDNDRLQCLLEKLPNEKWILTAKYTNGGDSGSGIFAEYNYDYPGTTCMATCFSLE